MDRNSPNNNANLLKLMELLPDVGNAVPPILGEIIANDKKIFKKRIEKYKDINLGQFTAEGIFLFQSKLTPEGAVHTKLKEYRLQTTDHSCKP